MKRFLLHTGSLVLAILLALVLADVVGVMPVEQPPIVCPDGTVAVWGTVRHEFLEEDLPNLSCRDDQGRPHGPNFNWADGHLLGLSFWDHGEQAGTTVIFYGNGRVWIVNDESAANPHTVRWSKAGLKEHEEIQEGDISRWSIWHENGTLKTQGNWAGKSAPYWLPDGSFNEDREDNSYLVGEYRSYYENGQPKNIGSYRDGARDGDWTCSDESGEHTVLSTFSEGRLISRTGDVDAEIMKDRCRESSCGRPKSTGVEPVAGSGQDTQRSGCSSKVS
jgi:antitoxin component YwqK of YwqJK toxin-antitoxin module